MRPFSESKAREILFPLAASVVMILLVSHRLIADGDPLWALATGKWIIAHRAVPNVDPFSWTALGKPWVAHEWGFDVLMYLLASLAGYYGLMLLTWAGLAGFYTFLWLLCRQEGKSTPAMVMVFTIAASFSGLFVMARPQVFSYFFFAGFLYILIRRPDRRWILPVMTLLWANLHASVVLGVIMVSFEAVSGFLAEREKSWFPVAGATFLASLVNPGGIDLWKYALWLSFNQWNRQIVEWRPPDFTSPVFLYSYFSTFLLLGAALYICQQHPVDKGDKKRFMVLAIYLCAFSYQAITQIRYFPYLLVIWAVMLLKLLPDELMTGEKKTWMKMGLAFLVVFAVIRFSVTFPREGVAGNLSADVAPVGAVRYLKAHKMMNHLFNFYTWGGYLIYEGVPVFIDGRDDLYLGSTGVFQDYVRAVELSVDPDQVLAKYGARTVLMSKDIPFTRYMEAEPQKWQVVYCGRVGEILVPAR